MRGRKPIPTKLKVLQGNPGKRPLNESEPKPEATDEGLEAPEFLNKVAREEWNRIVPIMRNLGVMTDVDTGIMIGYCQAYATLRKAIEDIEKYGLVYQPNEDKPYLQQTPFLSIANKAMTQMRKHASELGLTPSARARLSVGDGRVPKPRKKASGMGKFFE